MAKEDRSGEFVPVLGFFIAITTVLVALRCYCKIFIVKSFASDDYLSVVTLVRAFSGKTTASYYADVKHRLRFSCFAPRPCWEFPMEPENAGI